MNMFTLEEVRDLAARASTIDERLVGGYLINHTPASSRKARKRIELWCKYAADNNEALFRKHLIRDGLNIDDITPLLGDVGLSDNQPLPGWAETFLWAVEVLQSPDSSDASTQFINPDWPLPFENLFTPLVMAARERRDQLSNRYSVMLSENAQAALQRSLLLNLSEIFAPTLLEGFKLFQMIQQSMMMVFNLADGNSSSHCDYDAYITELRNGGLRDYFLNRPVLARLLSTIIDHWIEVTRELLNRLDADVIEIRKTFNSGMDLGMVTDIEYGLSDSHNNGRTVCILTFDYRFKVVYKPKDLGLDMAWQNLLSWLNTQGAPLSAKAPKILQREGYGWTEWIESLPCNDKASAKRFFNRAGSMLCLLYLLQGVDFHFENVIANGDQPVLVDLETLMHPWLAYPTPTGSATDAIFAASELLRDSVLATGYLPGWTVLPGNRVAGVGGLNPEDLYAYKHWKFQDVNTDGMKLVETSETVEVQGHRPTLKGEQLSCAAYRHQIVAGFKAMYYFLLNNRSSLTYPTGPLSTFKGQIVRVVLRPTQLYALVLRRSLENQNLSDGIDWSLNFYLLCRFSKWDEEKDSMPLVQATERYALTRLDIPFFLSYTDVSGIQLTSGRMTTEFFEKPSFEQTVERLQGLNETILNKQIAIIIQAIESTESHVNHMRTQPWKEKTKRKALGLTSGIAVDIARTFSDILERESVCAGKGVAWTGAVPLPGEQRSYLMVIGDDLYSGVSGIALFLAALEYITGGAGYRDLALVAMAPLCEKLRDREGASRITRTMGIGGGVGLGSVIYTMVRVATFLSENGLLEEAYRTALLVTNERIEEDHSLDVMAGAAGAILGLLALYEACQDDFVLRQATACGYHLISKQDTGTSGSKAWKTIGDIPPSGFSHGAAGIAYALLRLYKVTRNQAFLNAALDGIEYERKVFATEVGNWPDFSNGKDSPSFPCQWCHGAPGIGLARLGGLDILDDDEIRDEIAVALNTTESFPIGAMDHLCCGNFGRLEMLFTAGHCLGRGELISLAQYRAIQLLRRAEETHHFFWPSGIDAQNPGFFTGISGVGYQLLRMAHPGVLPSVLLWG